ncbi:MAG: TlpA family protein disulfide reductase [Proteobacteria bacterium]|nr:TlpA family protein disulfide reductase [Pseudomonadota bacterium]
MNFPRCIVGGATVVAVLALGACNSPPPGNPSHAAPAAARGSATATAPSRTASAQHCLIQPSDGRTTPSSDQPRPTLKVTTFDCGSFDLAQQRGRWVLVNFWATWCGPCLEEMPALSRLAQSRKDVVVIGLDSEDGIDAPTLAAFIKQHAPAYPIAVVDPYHPPADFESPRALPTSYLIGPDGVVVQKFLGPVAIEDVQKKIGPVKGGG